MGSDQDSLFSLELVIEKLYLPHTICRFPAVAFRLLDFPTIVIKHVEDELGENIKKKISLDPYFDIPNQFDELKDKRGDFMIKKGKSCLFKISADAMRTHLSNTPLYMMILDYFPDVTKLVGNSSIPLDTAIDAIHADITKLGNSIPSIHGDKGLFKVFSLMGKEVGYVVLGYRLLSLGPGLIPHIPDSAISNRMSVKETMVANESKIVRAPSRSDEDKMLGIHQDALNNTREMGSMTDVQKCDITMQTVEMCDKNVNVDLLNEENIKANKASSTQTEKKQKSKSVAKSKPDHTIVSKKKEIDDDDEGAVIVSNVIRPPPLFYNRQVEPPEDRHSVRPTVTYSFDDDDDDTTCVEDDITVENFPDDEIIPRGDHIVVTNQRIADVNYKKNTDQNIKYDFGKPQAAHPMTTIISHSQDNSDQLYPLITALLDELISLKDQRQIPAYIRPKLDVKSMQAPPPATAQNQVLSTPNTSVAKSKLKENIPVSEAKLKTDPKELKHAGRWRKNHVKCAHPAPGVPKFKGWIRQAPEYGIKKSKLVYGLTNTQRLRLAKGNPDWLKSTEKEVKEAKAQKQKLKDKNLDHDLELGNLSDTLTEVRRLASKELNETQKTLDSQVTLNQSLLSSRVRKFSPQRKRKETKTGTNIEISSRKASKSPKQQRKKYKNVATGVKKEHHLHGDESNKKEHRTIKVDPETIQDLQESYSQRSIEVKLPKAEMHIDEDSDDTLHSQNDHAFPSTRKQTKSDKFPGFIDKNTTIPDSIDGRSDVSLDVSLSSSEESPPLESTRASKDYRPNIEESKMFQSTDDYDTKQFHSTDEPELQKLMSDDNYSEQSGDEKTVRRSFQVINPVVSKQSPIPAIRRSQVKLDSLNAGPSATNTPRSHSSRSSSKRPTPRPRIKSQERRSEIKRDIHTESLSSYLPSEMDNLNTSITSDPNYSDDFQAGTDDDESVSVGFSSPDLQILIPSTKLGYTIS